MSGSSSDDAHFATHTSVPPAADPYVLRGEASANVEKVKL